MTDTDSKNLDAYRLENVLKNQEMLERVKREGKTILAVTMRERKGEERKSKDPKVREFQITPDSYVTTDRNDSREKIWMEQGLWLISCGIVPILQFKDGKIVSDFSRRDIKNVNTQKGCLNPAISKTKAYPYDPNPFAEIMGDGDNMFSVPASRLCFLDPNGYAIEPMSLLEYNEGIRTKFSKKFNDIILYSTILKGIPRIRPKWVDCAKVEFNDTQEIHVYWLDNPEPRIRRGVVNFEPEKPYINVLETIVYDCNDYLSSEISSLHCEPSPKGGALDLPKVYLKVDPKLFLVEPFEPLAVFKSGRQINPVALGDTEEANSVSTNIQLTLISAEWQKAAKSGVASFSLCEGESDPLKKLKAALNK